MARLLLWVWARRVPLSHRERWIDEWDAELSVLEARVSARSIGVRWWTTTRFALGAGRHASQLARLYPSHSTETMMMTTMGQDLRFALRSFARTPGFTIVAVLTLALGIGATTTMFSVLDGVLLRPLPYDDPQELVMVGSTSQRFPGLAPVSPGDFIDWRERNTTFSHMIATEWITLDLVDSDRPTRISSAAVSHGFFEMLGAVPLLGRGIAPEDEMDGSEPIVVLSHRLWQQRYGGDPSIVGRRIETADRIFTVAGVMPESFVHPDALWSEDVEIWLPTSQSGSNMTTRGGRFLQVMGRLSPSASVFTARQEMSAIATALEEEYPRNAGRQTLIEPLRSQTIGDVGQALSLLMGAVAMLLLIACVNVANLFMARAADRGREMAVRTAMGAAGSRIRAQLLTEGVALSLSGGVAGIGLAYLGVASFRAVNPVGIPRIEAVVVDARILAFAFLISVVTGIAFALAPAMRMVGTDALTALRDGARTGTGVAGARFRNTLVMAELALAVVLLVGAGLFVNSFLRLQNVDPGFDPTDVVAMSISLNDGYETSEQGALFFGQLLERIEALPGVSATTYASSLPLAGDRYLTGLNIEGREIDPANPDAAEYVIASPGYFSTLDIDIVAGREFTELDDAGAELTTIVNEAFVRRYWPGQDPLGKRFAMGRTDPEWFTVVGVSGDVHRVDLTSPIEPEVYFSALQRAVENAQVVARTDGSNAATVDAMRAAVTEMDGTLPVEFNTLEGYIAASVNQPQFYTQLFTLFALAALLLAAVGVYGTMSYTVGQRTREMGIRLALGAEASTVTAMVVRQGAVIAIVGLVVGLVGAGLTARVLESFLFGVGTHDPVTYAAGALFLGATAMAACWIPARRAGKADPMGALRTE